MEGLTPEGVSYREKVRGVGSGAEVGGEGAATIQD